jgi:hypothetical protein
VLRADLKDLWQNRKFDLHTLNTKTIEADLLDLEMLKQLGHNEEDDLKEWQQ